MSKYVEIDKEDNEQFSEDGAICPYCGYEISPDGDNYILYDDDTTSYNCHSCNKNFNVEIYISHCWTTRKLESINNDK